MPSPSPAAERTTPTPGAGFEGEVRRARPLLGTLVEIRAAGAHARVHLQQAIDAAFSAVERVQQLMSYHDPASELSRINREAAATAQRIDGQTYAVLQAALRFAALSEGAFDPCVGDPLEKWGYLPPNAPGPDRSQPHRGTWRDVDLVGHCRVRFGRAVSLDLGGIAKGYAVDRAVLALQSAGVENILVNAGGDLRIAGRWTQKLRLRHPQAPHLSSDVFALRNGAVATSAAYYSRRNGSFGNVSALLDPRTRKPYLGNGSVSVRAADCMSADALTKVVLFAAPEVAELALAACHARAIVQCPAAATA